MTLNRNAMLLAAALLAGAHSALSQAPDPARPGPFDTATGEYRLPADLDPLVLESAVTEIWATTHYPVDATGPLPTVVFMPGNRATCGTGSNPRFDTNCEYTETGSCPDDFVVVPSHEGFDYVAEPLASWGMVVVSINTNRGISCGAGVPEDLGLNKARGRMILRHLQLLSEWNQGMRDLPGGLPEELRGRLDFGEVGLVGHSRGGEGARAAYNLYLDDASGWQERILAPVAFEAIFEIAAVDGQTDTVFDANGTAWAQLLPMCDGDVFNLEGIKPMDRMLPDIFEAPTGLKASFTVWGANHNFFNSAWETSEIQGCVDHEALFPETIGSPEQRQIAQAAIMALMRGSLGADASPVFLRNFNPAYTLPPVVSDLTRVDRGYVDAPNRRLEIPLEDFSAPTGTNRYGFTNDYNGVDIEHDAFIPSHDRDQRAAILSWESASPDRYIQLNMAPPGVGRDVSRRRTLSFRISRQNPQPDFLSVTDFSIALVGADGTLSASVPLGDYLALTGPVGTILRRHTTMQTVRIPLAAFAGVDLTRFRGVRFTFDIPNPGVTDDDGGAVYIANVNLATRPDRGATPPREASRTLRARSVTRTPAAAPSAPRFSGRLASVRAIERSPLLGGKAAVEVVVTADTPFPVTNALPALFVDGSVSRLARYAADARQLTFVFASDEFRALSKSAAVHLQLGGQGRVLVGRLDDPRVVRDSAAPPRR